MRWDEGSLRGTTRLKTPRGVFTFLEPDNGGRPSGISRWTGKGGERLFRLPPFHLPGGSLKRENTKRYSIAVSYAETGVL